MMSNGRDQNHLVCVCIYAKQTLPRSADMISSAHNSEYLSFSRYFFQASEHKINLVATIYLL